MAPKGSCNWMGKATARAKMSTSVINQHLSLVRGCIKGFISEHIQGLIQIYDICATKYETSWDMFYDIHCFDSVTTGSCSQFQLMWLHRRSRWSPFLEWWAVCSSYMGQMFDKTCNKMINRRWDNPCAFGDQVDRSKLQITNKEKLILTSAIFSWHGSDDLQAMIEPQWSLQYRPVDVLAARPLNRYQIIDGDDDNENFANLRESSGTCSRHGNCKDKDDSEGEGDM